MSGARSGYCSTLKKASICANAALAMFWFNLSLVNAVIDVGYWLRSWSMADVSTGAASRHRRPKNSPVMSIMSASVP